MKILMLHGSPRKNGNTSTLLRCVTETAEPLGAQCEQIHLNTLQIRPCQGCGGCEKTGRCVIDDAMQDIYPRIDAADRVLLAGPIYFYALSAQLKICIDRLQALWSRKYLLGQAAPNAESRRGYLLSVAATRGERVFESALLSTRYAVDAMGIPFGGDHCVRGMDGRNALAGCPEELAKARAFAASLFSP